MNCNNPFFIVGSVRTGTTLLRRMLFNHPDIYIPPETYWIPKAYTRFVNCHRAGSDWTTAVNEVLGVLESDEYYKETFKHSLTPVRKQLYRLKSNTLAFAEIMDAFYFYHAALNGKKDATRWGDKTPCYSYNLKMFVHIWPKAKIIFMQRDAIDAIASSIKAGIYKYVEKACERYTDAQGHYSSFVTFADKPKGCITAVKYEDLVRYPMSTLRDICRFIGLDYRESLHDIPDSNQLVDVNVHDHLSNVAKPLFTDSIGKGLKTLTKEEIRVIRTKVVI